ncbi:39S ribosomal protein S30, mitochondrial [Octopus bimaculoides]|uniref:28S ribosomal protein S30, mitochondrial n=1 Tax=Octopus bimaculoides TaxID=37653 RepID=A0A0L8HL20_OCTBM|nr:39S ribosomal protein S30, mitochondrial [Octopus bimaculoides]|eukprot:XP_014771764.1 PREDICTED: 28S ribosomal protein S30, mitochondrial-like [Octopus bimaculoides]
MAMPSLMLSRSCRSCSRFSSFFHPNNRYASSVVSVNTLEEISDEGIQYPPIKPRWPPGSWGNMSEKRSWSIWEQSSKLKDPQLKLKDRFEMLSPSPEVTWKCPSVQHYPRSFEYQQYVTKTHMAPGMPEVYEQMEEEAMAYLQRIKPLIERVILFENFLIDRNLKYTRYNKMDPSNVTFLQTEQIINCLLSVLAPDYPYLLTSQFAENVRVRAFWDRYGFPMKPYVLRMNREDQFLHKMYSRFNTEFICSQIRTEKPLMPFVPRDSPLCTESEYSQFCYWPSDLSQQNEKVKNTCIPGFFYGDPCEFGLVSFHCSSQMQRKIKQFGPEITYEFQKGLGLMTSFAWTVAQAYFQGFSSFVELTYPLTTQTVITDGQKFSFFAYQLNTLEMWKDDDGNNLKNICWHTEEENLYEIKDGQIQNFNDNVLKQLIKFFINQPKEPNYPLRPYLQHDPSEIKVYLEDKKKKLSKRKETK